MKTNFWNAVTGVATTVIAVFVMWISAQIVEVQKEQARYSQWQTQVDQFMGSGTRFTQEAFILNLKPVIEKINGNTLAIKANANDIEKIDDAVRVLERTR